MLFWDGLKICVIWGKETNGLAYGIRFLLGCLIVSVHEGCSNNGYQKAGIQETRLGKGCSVTFSQTFLGMKSAGTVKITNSNTIWYHFLRKGTRSKENEGSFSIY